LPQAEVKSGKPAEVPNPQSMHQQEKKGTWAESGGGACPAGGCSGRRLPRRRLQKHNLSKVAR